MSICLAVPIDWELTAQIFTIVGAIGTILAIVFSIYSLNKTLYASERPYVVCYPVYEEQHKTIVLIVKNYGRSSAKIQSLSVFPEMIIYKKSINTFLNNTLIAPNQQMHFLVDFDTKDKIFVAGMDAYKIEIVYCDVNKPKKLIYETNNISVEYMRQIMSTRTTKSNNNNVENSLFNIEKALNIMSMKTL